MKANELRIGNLVYNENKQIVSILASRIVLCEDKRVNYQPIPLTEEWLLKCGFKKIGSNFELDWLILHTHIQTGEFHFLLNEPHSRKYRVTKLIYLHQLQNLYFALTGEELKIEL